MKLILFDIDGTLIDGRGAGKEAYFRAVEEIHGKNYNTHVSFMGKTDRGVIHEILKGHRDENEIERITPFIWKRYLEYLPLGFIRERGVTMLPGIPMLLENISEEVRNNGSLLGLLTGNIREGARVKLEHFDLFKYFSFGAYGHVSRYRNDLPGEALRLAKEMHNKEYSGKDIVIIGDTPDDILCGKHLNVKSIAVATGRHTMEQLASENPDHLFIDLSDTTAVQKAIFQ